MYQYWLKIGIYLWETVKVYNIVLYIYEKIFGACWHDWGKWEDIGDGFYLQAHSCKKCNMKAFRSI